MNVNPNIIDRKGKDVELKFYFFFKIFDLKELRISF